MRSMIYAIIALAFGYSPAWMAHYISIFAGSELQVVGDLDDFEVPCTAAPRDQGRCFHQYNIPDGVFAGRTNESFIGLGSILVATEIICGTQAETVAVLDDPSNPGRSYDSYNSYVTLPLSAVCRQGMIVRAWARADSTRNGLIGGRLVVGSEVYVQAIKKATEFFTKDIRTLVLLLFCFGFLVRRGSASLATSKSELDPFEKYAAGWIGFLIISSGLMQLVLPIHAQGFYSRLSALFAVAAHLGPIALMTLGAIQREGSVRRDPSRRTLWVVWLGGVALAVLPSLTQVFGQVFLVPAIAGLAVGIATRRSVLIWYAVVLGMSSLKLLNLPYTPLSHVTALYAALVIVDVSIGRMTRSKHLLDSISIGRRLVAESTREVEFA